MNTETGQIKNMTSAEMKSSDGKWVEHTPMKIPLDILYRRVNRSKYKPHIGKKQLAKLSK